MFKKFKNHDNYFAIAVYAFLVIVASIALVWLLVNLSQIWGWLSGVIAAMSPFIYGFIIAYICNPIYKRLHKYAFKFIDKKKPRPKLRKGLSITTTYIIFFAIAGLLILAIVPQIVINLRTLIESINEYTANITNWVSEVLIGLSEKIPAIQPEEIMSYIMSFFSSSDGSVVSSILDFLLDNVINVVTIVANQILYILVGLILSIYFLIYKDSIVARGKRFLCAIFKQKAYDRIIDFGRYTDRTFGRYMLGSLLDSAMVGIVMFLAISIANLIMDVDIPFAPLIAVICGITNIIPFFGPFIGAIPSALLIFIATGNLFPVIIFAIIVVVLQQVDGNLIAPHIHGASTGLTPIGVIAAVTFTSHVFGFIGMVIGVPFCAVISYYISLLIDGRLKKKHMPIQTEYYRVSNVFEDENFKNAIYTLEAEDDLAKSEAIASVAAEKEIKEEVLHKIEEQVVEHILTGSLDQINEQVEAKASDGEV